HVVGSSEPFVDRRDIAFRPGIENVRVRAGQWKIAAYRGIVETRNGPQGIGCFFRESIARAKVGISRLRHRDEPDPKMSRAEAKIFAAQVYKAGNQQPCACQ